MQQPATAIVRQWMMGEGMRIVSLTRSVLNSSFESLDHSLGLQGCLHSLSGRKGLTERLPAFFIETGLKFLFGNAVCKIENEVVDHVLLLLCFEFQWRRHMFDQQSGQFTATFRSEWYEQVHLNHKAADTCFQVKLARLSLTLKEVLQLGFRQTLLKDPLKKGIPAKQTGMESRPQRLNTLPDLGDLLLIRRIDFTLKLLAIPKESLDVTQSGEVQLLLLPKVDAASRFKKSHLQVQLCLKDPSCVREFCAALEDPLIEDVVREHLSRLHLFLRRVRSDFLDNVNRRHLRNARGEDDSDTPSKNRNRSSEGTVAFRSAKVAFFACVGRRNDSTSCRAAFFASSAKRKATLVFRTMLSVHCPPLLLLLVLGRSPARPIARFRPDPRRFRFCLPPPMVGPRNQ